jgi:hypothetical protein
LKRRDKEADERTIQLVLIYNGAIDSEIITARGFEQKIDG